MRVLRRLAAINQHFRFSSLQLKFLLLASLAAVAMSVYLVVRAYAVAPPSAEPLPVLLGDGRVEYAGVFQLDPNTAPADSLELLPGIGPTLADRIIEYRRTHRFERAVDITEVRGLGSKTFERLRPYLKITPP